jgi:phosphoribosylanthranilate isomerase
MEPIGHGYEELFAGSMLVKICGLTRREDAEVAVAAGADLLGFVFVPGTPRAVTPAETSWVRSLEGAATVGVFRDASLKTVLAVRDALQLDWVQLHGEEPDEWLGRLGPQVIRRVPVAEPIDWERIEWLAQRCLPLLDPGAGDGLEWDWRALVGRPPGLRFGVAGGLTPESVGDVVRAVRPALVDVSSGVERSLGVKDPGLVRAFVAAARGAVLP